jgi:GT2 family glycosyltransferase
VPKVSIVILSYHHPEITGVCLRQLEKFRFHTEINYEVVVVDNGSEPETLAYLRQWHNLGMIQTLVENRRNAFFSEGNNIGVANTDPESEYLLFMNSDVAVIHPEWLDRLMSWMNGTAEHWPTVWGLKPNVPKDEPLDILSAGWRHDANIDSKISPEGFCMLWRRSVWRPFDENFPFHHGWEHTATECIRDGAKCGVLFNYSPYLVHREQGSGQPIEPINNVGAPDHGAWFAGLEIQSLDFYLGPDEHSSYLAW